MPELDSTAKKDTDTDTDALLGLAEITRPKQSMAEKCSAHIFYLQKLPPGSFCFDLFEKLLFTINQYESV